MTMNYRANRKRRFQKHMWKGRDARYTHETAEELNKRIKEIRNMALYGEDVIPKNNFEAGIGDYET